MSDPSLAAETPPAPEACPPPLDWREVLQSVDEQGASFRYAASGIELDGIAIGDGPPIWFLNGIAGDRRLFSLLAWLLRDRFRCYLTDANWPEDTHPGSLQVLLARAYELAIRALGTPRPALFGTGFGTQTALTLMTQSSDIRAAVLHEGFYRRRPSLVERVLEWGASKSNKRLSEIPNWPQLQEANHRRWFPPIDPTRWDFLVENLGATTLKRWSLMARAAEAARDVESQSRDIETPILLLRTEGDGPVATESMNELMVGLRNVREETLHTSGHFAFLTHPHRVAKIVSGFLASI